MEDPDRVQAGRDDDRLVVRLAAPGLAGPAGLLLGLAGFWIALGLAGLGGLPDEPALRGLFGGVAATGLAAAGAALRRAGTAWRVDATPHAVTLVREGVLASRVRGDWPAWDVASFWVHDEGGGDVLVMGFGNGRHERLPLPAGRAELQRMAALLRDERPRPHLPRDPAGVRAGADEAQPRGVELRRRAAGFEIRLLPLGGVGRKVVLPAVLAFVGLVLAAMALPGAACWILLPAGSAGILAAATARAAKVRAAGAVELDGEILRVAGAGAWSTGRIEHVQALPEAGGAELQLLLKDRGRVRLLPGRPAAELEWLARFLRASLGGPDRDELLLEEGTGSCPVCGDPMTARVVFCVRCRTPHHAECWAYVGQCSTYGCREIGCVG